MISRTTFLTSKLSSVGLLLGLGALGLAACSATGDAPAVDDSNAGAALSDPTRLPAGHNPVLAVDCPDPGVLRDDDAEGAIYYMVCTTNAPNDVFRIYTSRDLLSWTTTDKFVFPGKYSERSNAARHHPWANDNFWAPEIHRMPDDASPSQQYVVYYTARNRDNHRLCIGTAAAPTALGPYVESAEPLVCHDDYGVIDATYFRDDDGRAYLYWKNDGNDPDPEIQKALGGHTKINVQRLTNDGLHLADADGAPSDLAEKALIDHSLDWEGDLVEAPWMVKRNGAYYLFYSAFSYCDSRYAVGVARAKSPLGPFTKNPTGDPILSSGDGFDGPGHGSVVPAPGSNSSFVFVYHSWNAGESCVKPGGERRILVDSVSWHAAASGAETSPGTWPLVNDGHPSAAR